jgi:hypothetical protein
LVVAGFEVSVVGAPVGTVTLGGLVTRRRVVAVVAGALDDDWPAAEDVVSAGGAVVDEADVGG